ncbi:hypothetical protein EVAR_22893_1 [Eumeta japonica]|uniref:Uncharacterized protein n=1 Tax=Eumeta variegata TaxID=151549 RepID=A0A4C1UU19_EUMVA|nr:hypothetical protein EVAR_22893_1 [Eumeta japonica]
MRFVNSAGAKTTEVDTITMQIRKCAFSVSGSVTIAYGAITRTTRLACDFAAVEFLAGVNAARVPAAGVDCAGVLTGMWVTRRDPAAALPNPGTPAPAALPCSSLAADASRERELEVRQRAARRRGPAGDLRDGER